MNLPIVLGGGCDVSFALESLDIKQKSSVFEWFSSIEFQDVLDAILGKFQNVKLISENGVRWKDTSIHSSHYHLPHYQQIFDRRSKRFLDEIQGSKPIVFIRKDIDEDRGQTTIQQMLEFCDFVTKENPQLDFSVIWIQCPEKECDFTDLSQGRIRHYCMTRDKLPYAGRWNADNVDIWKPILKEHNLL